MSEWQLHYNPIGIGKAFSSDIGVWYLFYLLESAHIKEVLFALPFYIWQMDNKEFTKRETALVNLFHPFNSHKAAKYQPWNNLLHELLNGYKINTLC